MFQIHFRALVLPEEGTKEEAAALYSVYRLDVPLTLGVLFISFGPSLSWLTRAECQNFRNFARWLLNTAIIKRYITYAYKQMNYILKSSNQYIHLTTP